MNTLGGIFIFVLACASLIAPACAMAVVCWQEGRWR